MNIEELKAKNLNKALDILYKSMNTNENQVGEDEDDENESNK